MTVTARSDRVAARATGVGVGLITFMVTWLVGARVTDLIWDPPLSATVAMAIAVLVGILTSIVAGSRLLRTVGAKSTWRAEAVRSLRTSNLERRRS